MNKLMEQESVVKLLKNLKKILIVEKDALIQNKGDIIEEIVQKKETMLEKMETAEINEKDQEDILGLISEIKELQETNAMLTQQAMNYANTFIAAFQKEAQKQATYSKEGQYEKKQSTGLLDQSL